MDLATMDAQMAKDEEKFLFQMEMEKARSIALCGEVSEEVGRRKKERKQGIEQPTGELKIPLGIRGSFEIGYVVVEDFIALSSDQGTSILDLTDEEDKEAWNFYLEIVAQGFGVGDLPDFFWRTIRLDEDAKSQFEKHYVEHTYNCADARHYSNCYFRPNSSHLTEYKMHGATPPFVAPR